MTNKLFKIVPLLGAAMILLFGITLNAEAQRKAGGGGNKPAGGQRSGGAQKPAASQRSSGVQKPAQKNQAAGNRGNVQGTGNRGNNNVGNNRTGNGNKVNIDNSKRNVNVNVDNSKNIRVNNQRNTAVRRNVNYRPYPRPPYVYGGYRYRCYHPYYYHPYRPFVWGPVWHPWGFFVATLATTAIIISIADADLPPVIQADEMMAFGSMQMATYQNSRGGPNLSYFEPFAEPEQQPVADGDYYYDQGVYYLKENGGYTVVAAPIGAVIKTLPSGYETVVIDETAGTKNFYWGGTFYEKTSSGYKVVPATAGAVVEHLSDGGEEVKMGDVTYVKLGETYYQPIQQNGKNVYEVADVEEDK